MTIKTLGQRLKELREAKGLTQEQVAEAIDVAVNTYARYEYDLRFPTTKIAVKIADLYDMSMKELFSGEPPVREERKITERDIRFALSSGEEPITPEQYQEVRQFVRFIQERDNGNL